MLKPAISSSLMDFMNREGIADLTRIKRGVEKESLRVTPDGYLSMRPHPKALGSALTNPCITTDYSEALPEFITPPSEDREAPVARMKAIHQFVYRHLDDELLWASSMPCAVTSESDIPLAQFGSSNVGRMKHIYRVGLSHRYGSMMQTIAGVHYNFSMPDSFWLKLQRHLGDDRPPQEFVSARYMALARNFLRYGWLVPLIYGASPALCKSFLQGRHPGRLKTLKSGTLYGPWATSLRMSDLGYQSNAQSRLNVSYNCVDDYVGALEYAISTEDPFYRDIGVKVDGEYRQLNANLLQIENEYYSGIRPKRVIRPGERPTQALRRGGVEYIEVRVLDLNPFSPIGFTQQQQDFLDVFLLFCLLQKSPPITEREAAENQINTRRVVTEGRSPDLHMCMGNRDVSKEKLLDVFFRELRPLADLLDAAWKTDAYSCTVHDAEEAARNPEKSVSGRFLQQLTDFDGGFFSFVASLSRQHKAALGAEAFSARRLSEFEQQASRSLARQAEIEASDTLSFEEYLANYFA